MSQIKSKYDIEQMRISAQVTAKIVDALGKMCRVGVSAAELETKALEMCQEEGVEPAFLNFEGYKYATCISVNDEVVHATPLARKIFQEGDVVSVDFGVKWKGYYSDHCRTFPVGKVNTVHEELLIAGEQAVENGIKQARAGNAIGDISFAEQSTAENAGFSIVYQYIGHGIGKKLHEWPEVPAVGEKGTGPKLEPGMVICVECQVCEGEPDLVHDPDGWTTRTKDGKYAVMFEHMVHITEGEPEVLTRL